MKNLQFLLMFLFISSSVFAQSNQLSGKITDGKNEALIGVNIILTSVADAKIKHFAVTDTSGNFKFAKLNPEKYTLKATYVGFDDLTQDISITLEDQNLGVIQMFEKSNVLQEVQVKAKVAAAIQKGDTLQYNADAFKVNKDAQAEDLLKKMPGITVDNGSVTAHGETVKEILVDGKPFFGDDPTIAMKNLPAEVIDKIEVFDKQSDQSQFTGFNDGNTSKTINIITRADKRNGKFGKIYGGYGTNDTYSAGGNINLFNKDRRISIVGMSNNINQQNFSSQDLLGISSSGGGGGGGGRGGGGPGGGGNASNNFLVGQQSGINKTNSYGINYSDNWGKKLTVRGSYFFNNSSNTTEKSSQREYFLSTGTNQFYRDSTLSTSMNTNHRFNFRFEYTIDPKNSILFTPRLSFQTNNSNSSTQSRTLLGTVLQNTSNNQTQSNNSGYSFSQNLLLRHKFDKKGRTLAFNFGTDINNKDSQSDLMSKNEFFGKTQSVQLINQRTTGKTDSYQLTGNLTYTEPVTDKSMLQLSYNIGYSNNQSSRLVNKINSASQEYDQLDSLLSNKFDNDYVTQRFGVGYNIMGGQKLRLVTNLSFQKADLSGQQLFPINNETNRTFNNIIPMLIFDYKISDDKKFHLIYRASTNAPSISQLQNVINNSNPLVLTTGNPNLQQEYSHSLSARYSITTPAKAQSFVALLSANYTLSPIGNSTLIADKPITLPGGVVLGQGGQLIRPVNFDNSVTARGFVTYGTPLSFIKTNLNLNSSVNYSRSPGLINDQVNFSNNYTFSQGIVLASNVSEKVDFTLSYNFNYNKVENTIQSKLNNNYYYQTASAKFNWIFGKGFVFQTDLNQQTYTGLADSFNQKFTLWNAAFGKKFLKKQAGELKISVFDLLNQNSSITRNLTETYLEDVRSLVLRRYFMLTFTYSLRAFGLGGNSERNRNNPPMDGGGERRFDRQGPGRMGNF
ncbi:Outer membrane receptor proteins, mostly Fe transport [Pseudarcicella hirudinis]|uniref:Outer membrane receptor proteins, mostly Fe transport n=1 Tax=Pseudarcicella hirudinis TaxID=1079859 RepID=A0A1I5T517_9BACT|nr:outer membrane beta-barrel protein [Pseudarcicella hirudinis]SFP78058.1 Outer membrane receptor proteins, mostly Fe transport [Pseudarcicella hirudinis]